MNLTEQIIRYETGEIESEEEMFELFQELVDTGLAWTLPGRYGRAARDLIEAGLVKFYKPGRNMHKYGVRTI